MAAVCLALLAAAVRLRLAAAAEAPQVVTLTTGTFDQHLKDNTHTLVEFYAPWCGHCKKLAPDFEKAAVSLKSMGHAIKLAKVDATEEKELATKYNVKGYPTLLWFEDGKSSEFDGGRTSTGIVDWVTSMIGTAVIEQAPMEAPSAEKPQLVLYADSLLPGFQEAAKANRRKASWYFVKLAGLMKVTLTHKGEEAVELTGSACGEKDSVLKFLAENQMPLFGPMDGDTFDKYLATEKGLVWSLFPAEDSMQTLEAKHRPMMVEVAKQVKGKYLVTYTDVAKFKEAVDNMLGVATFPAIAVQRKAGDKKRYIYDGEMTATRISQFIQDVDAGRVSPKFKSEPEPPASDDLVKVVVGTTLQREVFTPDKDVLLEVYAPWCGHCRKLEPEYTKLAKKIQKEELTDLLSIAKIDGTLNDSPIDSIDWQGFPAIFFVKAGSSEPETYTGERTAKGLWKYIKKHATQAQEIKERLERRRGGQKRGEEL